MIGNKEIVKLLIEKGGDVFAKDNKGRTALEYIKSRNTNNKKDIIPILEEAEKEQKTHQSRE